MLQVMSCRKSGGVRLTIPSPAPQAVAGVRAEGPRPRSRNKGLEPSATFWNLSPWLPHPHAYLPFWLGPEPGTGDLSLPYCGRTSLKLRACRVCIPIPRSPMEPPPSHTCQRFPLAPSSPAGPPKRSTEPALGSGGLTHVERGLHRSSLSLLTSPSLPSAAPTVMAGELGQDPMGIQE